MERLIQVVHKGARHPWYQRTVDLASLYRKLVTGDGLDELLKQFVKREDQSAFDQRKALTQHVITSVVKNIMDVFEKVPRSNYKRILEYSSDRPGSLEELEILVGKYWGVKSLDEYQQTRWLELSAIDPNAFIVTEFKPFNNNHEHAQSYPFEVSSADAVDYSYENNVLQYLNYKSTFPLPLKNDEKKIGDKYTLYLANETLLLTEIDPARAVTALLTEAQFVDAGDVMYLLSNKRVYMLEFATPHGAEEVPAKPVGYLRDSWTEGQTFVAPYDAAVPILLKSIKVNSELDLTMSLSAFPFRLEYAPACKADGCYGGRLENGEQCGTCKGTGHTSVTSAQEKLVITLPKPGNDLHDLDKLVVFKSPQVDILKFQAEYVESLTNKAKQYVFNGDSLTRSTVTTTATENLLDRDNLNDTLFKCGKGYSENWAYMVRLLAKFAQLDKDLVFKLVIEKDLIRKGLTELLADLDAANRSEAGPSVKQNIQTDIARLIYADNPEGFKVWQAKQTFNPFAGYSDAEIALALSDTSIPQRVKTQYLMLGVLFDDLEFDYSLKELNFYDLAWSEQRKAVDAKVKSYMDESAASATAKPILPPLNGKAPAVMAN